MKGLDIWIKNKIMSIGHEEKVAFLSCFFVGLVCHLFVMVGHYPAYSGLNLFVNSGVTQIVEGRWFAAVIMRSDGVVTLPFILGIVMLILYSMTCSIVVKILELESNISIVLFSSMFITFPVIAAKNYFLYMADCYGASVFLACLGVWFWKKSNKLVYSIISIMSLTLSIATYQADLSVALVLFAIVLFSQILNNYKIKEIISNACRAIIIALASLASWYCVFKTYLTIFSANSYRDIKINISTLLYGIRKSYEGAAWFINDTFYSLPVGRIVIVLCVFSIVIFGGIVCFYLLRECGKTKFVRLFFVIIIICILPIIANYTLVIAPDEHRTYRLFFAHAFIIGLPVILCEKYSEKIESLCNLRIKKIVGINKKITVIMAVIAVSFFAIISNTGYMNAHLNYERDYSLAIRMIDRIETTEGYYPGMDVVLIQTNDFNTYNGETNNILGEYIPEMEESGYGLVATVWGVKNFMDQFIHTKVNFVDEEASADIVAMLEVFPSTKCTIVKNGKLYFLLT